MWRHNTYRKREAERWFPFRVDIPVPPVIGLGNRINEMHAWCRANIRAGEWEQHRHSEKQPGQIAVARFYFLIAEDADLFRWRWGMLA